MSKRSPASEPLYHELKSARMPVVFGSVLLKETSARRSGMKSAGCADEPVLESANEPSIAYSAGSEQRRRRGALTIAVPGSIIFAPKNLR
jgi:hypothetical protein